MRRNRMVRGLKMALMAAAGVAAFTALVMVLWNRLVPPIFGGRPVGFFQAMGLLVLSKILFGGFRGGWGHRGGHWPRRLRERWEQMTPEEREKFRQGLKCGCILSEPAAGGTVQAADR